MLFARPQGLGVTLNSGKQTVSNLRTEINLNKLNFVFKVIPQYCIVYPYCT